MEAEIEMKLIHVKMNKFSRFTSILKTNETFGNLVASEIEYNLNEYGPLKQML